MRACCALALIAAATLFRLLFLGEVAYDARFQGEFAPWKAAGQGATALGPWHPNIAALRPDPEADPLDRYRAYWASLVHDDLVLSVWPEHVVAREQLRAGTLPLWNPNVLGGVPLFAAGMVSPASPLSWLAYLLPAMAGRSVLLWLHLALAGVLFYAFLIARGLRPAAAATGGVAYMLNPLFVQWLYYGSVVPVMALMPLGLLLVERLQRDDDAPPAQRPLRPIAALAALTALEVLSGNAQFALYAIAAQGLYACALAISTRRPGLVLLVAGATLLGLFAASIFLLPFVEATAGSGRPADKYAANNWLHPALLLCWLFPRLYGHPGHGDYVGGFLFFRPASTTFGVTLGAAALALALIGAVARRRKLLPAGIALLLAGLVALTFEPLRAFVHEHVPGFATLDVLRTLIFVYFALAWLAADGVDALLEDGASAARRAVFAAPALSLLAVLLLEALATRADRMGAHLAYLRAPLLLFAPRIALPCLLGAAIAALALLLRARRIAPRIAAVALPALVALELAVLAHPTLPSAPAERLLPPSPVTERLRSMPAPGRVLGLTEPESFPPYTGDNLPPNTAEALGLRDVRGYVPLPPARVLELHQAAAREPFPAAVHVRADTLALPLFDLLDARYVLSAQPLPAPRFVSRGDGLWENTAAVGRAFFTGCTQVIADPAARLAALTAPDFDPLAHAMLETAVPGAPSCARDPAASRLQVRDVSPREVRIELDAPRAGVVVLTDSWYPGWELEVDGASERVLRVDHALRGAVVSPGRHTLVFRYRPGSFADGAWLSLLAWLAIAALAFVPAAAQLRVPRLSDDWLLALVAGVMVFAFAWREPLPNDNDALYAGVMRSLREDGWRTWIMLRNGEVPFMDKPPLYFWAGAALTSLLGEGEFALRLLALVAGVAGVVLVARSARRLGASRAAAALGGLALLAAQNYFEYSRRVYMEVPVAVLGFWAFELGLRERWKRAGLVAGLAFMGKTIVGGLGLAALGLAELLRRRIPRGLIAAALVAVLVIVPWHVLAYLADPDVFLDFTYRLHVRDQIAHAQPWSSGGPFFYFGVLFGQDLVMGLLLLAGVGLGVRSWLRTRDFTRGALLIAIALQLALYSLSATKKPFYILTLYPFIALLATLELSPWLAARRRAHWLAGAVLALLFALFSAPLIAPDLAQQESTYLEPLARKVDALAARDAQLYTLDLYLASPQFYARREAIYAVPDDATYQLLARIPYLRYGKKVVVWSDDLLRRGGWLIAPAPQAEAIARRVPGSVVVARNEAAWLLHGPPAGAGP